MKAGRVTAGRLGRAGRSQPLQRENFRACPQINVAAEFAEAEHPARGVARAHMRRLRERLTDLAEHLGAPSPPVLGAQRAILIKGAFVSKDLLSAAEAAGVLQASMRPLVETSIGRSAATARSSPAVRRPARR
jgi:hypothetical protein